MLTLVGIAGVALVLFAITPAPYNIIWMLVNGFPLGMIWGLVFSYLEGRKNTEILGAGLCVSFIVSSGVVKSMGKYVMLSWGVSEFWMPFVTAMIFAIPLVICFDIVMLTVVVHFHRHEILLSGKTIH